MVFSCVRYLRFSVLSFKKFTSFFFVNVGITASTADANQLLGGAVYWRSPGS